MSVLNMFVCRRCEENKRKMSTRLQLILTGSLLAIQIVTLIVAGWLAYRLLGSELACVPPAEFLERLNQEETQ